MCVGLYCGSSLTNTWTASEPTSERSSQSAEMLRSNRSAGTEASMALLDRISELHSHEHQEVLPYTLPGLTASQGWNNPTNLSQLPYSVAEGTYAFSQCCNLCIWNEPFGNQRICIFSAKVEYSCCLRPSSCCCTSELFALLRTPDYHSLSTSAHTPVTSQIAMNADLSLWVHKSVN